MHGIILLEIHTGIMETHKIAHTWERKGIVRPQHNSPSHSNPSVEDCFLWGMWPTSSLARLPGER